MQDAYLLAGARTPIGRFLGGLSSLSATDLGGLAIRAALERSEVAASDVDEVIMGNVLSAGLGQAPARQAAIKGGVPESVPAFQVNKVCGSGLKAVMLADQAIRAGDAEVIVAGGMENMSQVPRLVRGTRSGVKLGDLSLEDAMVRDGLWCAFDDRHMGVHAEGVASEHGVSREDQDAYALQSQQRAVQAQADGRFDAEVVPVEVRGGSVTQDEGPRSDTTMGGLAGLRPVFDRSGSVTAGNASTLADGAAAVVVGSEAAMRRSRAPWAARIVAARSVGRPPRELFIAPVDAIRAVVEGAGMTLDQIDRFEINEAFASQSVACLRALDLDPEKVNVNGGAIALGHPIGASGTRVLVTLLAELARNELRFGVASLCSAPGEDT